MTPELLDFIKENILAEFAAEEIAAAYGGRYTDICIINKKENMEYYCLGYQRKIPEEWKVYKKRFEDIFDPEFIEYSRLKKKFEGDKNNNGNGT